MPIYQWKCDQCDFYIEVVRSFNDYLVPPAADELEKDAKKACKEEGQEHKWTKLVGSSIRALRGPNWRGGKGHW